MLEQVSVIMPAYNSEQYIRSAIDSVLEQSYTQFELLIIDDCSDDRTSKIVKEYTDKRIKLIQLEENTGASGARNLGIAKAKGRYIAFLDSDDLWKQDKLMKQILFMKEQDIALCYSAYEVMNVEGEQITGIVDVPSNITYKQLLKNTIIGCLTVVIDTKKTGKVEMPSFKGAEDTATWLSILRVGHKAAGVTEVLACYRKTHTSSLSSNKLNMAKQIWQVYRYDQKLSLLQSAFYFPCYVWNGFFKHIRTGGSIRTIR
ncbi:TuaG [Listeria fleischmannii 1991]|uniref:Spore coat polysaccharide biosynthesis protein spsA n=2 Tax=Listeria fleischmannii TaxID=1069827 RepID=A0A2X3J856_9LIST|nr:glycosyltransferase family 2 protein [Listeria fleischmannii]EMG26697.1 family 2 glycosyl transferase [Listeria fleischmannii subsp. fleischmannii LU2006-1]KMT61438.1 TuaG [Listeria fleischmannii 1991]SQC70400.1 Spore coat polysaccharide biosynthesis protein spsA [Listeria fleischmannii subsp. fleischmannii]